MAKINPNKAMKNKAKMIKVENYHRLAKQKIEVLMHLQMLSSILDNSSIPYVYHNFNAGEANTIADTWRKEEEIKKAKEKQQAPAVPAIPAAAKKPADVQVPPQEPAPQSAPTTVKKTGGQPSRGYQRKQSALLRSLKIKPADLVKRLQDAGYLSNDKKPPIKEEIKEEAFVYTSEFKEAIIKLQKYFGMPDCAGGERDCADGLYGPNTHLRWKTIGFDGPQASTETGAAGEKSAPAAPAPESAPAANPRPKKHRVKKGDKSAQFNMDDLLKQAIAEVKRGRNNNE